jgi:hypothetical protein
VREAIGYFSGLKERMKRKPEYVFEFEEEIRHFIHGLTPGEFELLFVTLDRQLKIYHSKEEVKVVSGFPARLVATGKEEIFVEVNLDGDYYHLIGSYDIETGIFRFKRLEKGEQKGYSRVPLKREVIIDATNILRGYELVQKG